MRKHDLGKMSLHLEDPRCFKVYFQTKALMEEVRRTGDASPLFYEGRR